MESKRAAAWIFCSALAILLLVAATGAASTEHPGYEEWASLHEQLEPAEIDGPTLAQAAASSGSLSLLPHLPYPPGDREQGRIANCWVWAGTALLEIAHSVQNGVRDPLSIQYVDSNFNGGSGERWAGRTGTISDFATFYRAKGRAIPRSNTNADFRVGDGAHADWCTANQRAWVAASSIATNPHYPIRTITAQKVSTAGTRAETIARLKALLNKGKAVELSLVWQNRLDLAAFQIFWNSAGDEAVYDPVMWQGTAPSGGYYHEMAVVGYDDTNPTNRYWIVLNSWGTADGWRPNGTFRMNMDIDYTSKAATWTTLNVTFGPRSLAPAGSDQDPPVLAVPGGSGVPTDMDADGTHEDVNGNGRLEFADVVLFFNEMAWIAANEPTLAFDFNANSRVDFADAVQLFNRV